MNKTCDFLGQNWYYKIYKGYHIQTGNFFVFKHVYNQHIIPKLRERVDEYREKLLVHSENNEHPFIAHVYASLTFPIQDEKGQITEGQEFYAVVEEFLENGSLFTLIKKGYQLSENVVAKYIDQILQGLQFMHKTLNMAHLNIKSQNVMLSKNGQVKLSDIGFVLKTIEYAQYRPVINYTSPTLIQFSDAVCSVDKQKQADIWSVGCLTLELLTGKPPFHDCEWDKIFETLSSNLVANQEQLVEKYFPKNCSILATDFLRCCFRKDSRSIKKLLTHPWITECIAKLEIQPTHPPILSRTPNSEDVRYIFMVNIGNRKKKLSSSKFSSIKELQDYIKEKCDSIIKATILKRYETDKILVFEIFDTDCNAFIELDDVDLVLEAPYLNQIRLSSTSLPPTPVLPKTNSDRATKRKIERIDEGDNSTPSIYVSSAYTSSMASDLSSASSTEETKVMLWNDRYLPLRKIQSGGFSSVFLCEDFLSTPETLAPFTRKQVAIKVVSIEQGVSQSFNEAMREALQILHLSHPNIVKVLDVFQQRVNTMSISPTSTVEHPYTNLILCIVMPYYHFGDLSTLLSEENDGYAKKRIPLKIVRSIIHQILDALVLLHSKNIIHRDIKPQNILIEQLERSSHNKIRKAQILLCDFGLSKSMTESKAFSMSGTTLFMAPELQLNQGYGLKADIWSTGILLYQLLSRDTKTNIFLEMIQKGEEKTRATLETKIDKIYEHKISKPSKYKLKQLLWTMLKFHPEERATAQQCLDIIKKNK